MSLADPRRPRVAWPGPMVVSTRGPGLAGAGRPCPAGIRPPAGRDHRGCRTAPWGLPRPPRAPRRPPSTKGTMTNVAGPVTIGQLRWVHCGLSSPGPGPCDEKVPVDLQLDQARPGRPARPPGRPTKNARGPASGPTPGQCSPGPSCAARRSNPSGPLSGPLHPGPAKQSPRCRTSARPDLRRSSCRGVRGPEHRGSTPRVSRPHLGLVRPGKARPATGGLFLPSGVGDQAVRRDHDLRPSRPRPRPQLRLRLSPPGPWPRVSDPAPALCMD